MTEIPRVIYLEKDTEFNVESEATEVDNILQEIYNLKGEQLNYLTQFEFEDLLRKLMQYVTLIGFEIRPKVYKTKPKSDDEKLLICHPNHFKTYFKLNPIVKTITEEEISSIISVMIRQRNSVGLSQRDLAGLKEKR